VAEPSLSVRTDRTGSTLTLHVTGEVDMATAPRLAAALDTALDPAAAPDAISDAAPDAISDAERPRRLVVDLAGVGFLDSAGLHVLIDLAARLDPAGCELAVVCPVGAPPRRVIELTGLAGLLGLTAAHPGPRRGDVPAPRRP
jgi:anti-sigma B factor antagonist